MLGKQYEMIYKLSATVGENFKGTFNSAQKILAATRDKIQDVYKRQGDDFGIPQYSADTSKADLQSIANEYGIEVSAAATKQELIKALDDFFADALSDDPEGE